MEVSELITIIREDYLDDVFDGWESATTAQKADQFLWSDAALLRYINEAQRQACNRTDFLFDDSTYSLTLVEAQATYTLNQKITFIEQVTFDSDTDVTHLSKDEFQAAHTDWRTKTGIDGNTPYYTVRGRTLRIYPIPDADDAGKTLALDVYRLPIDDITATCDELVIPEEYHRDLIWWVLYEAYSKRDAETYDPEKAQMYLAAFSRVFGTYVPSEVRLNQLQENKSLYLRPTKYTSSLTITENDDDW